MLVRRQQHGKGLVGEHGLNLAILSQRHEQRIVRQPGLQLSVVIQQAEQIRRLGELGRDRGHAGRRPVKPRPRQILPQLVHNLEPHGILVGRLQLPGEVTRVVNIGAAGDQIHHGRHQADAQPQVAIQPFPAHPDIIRSPVLVVTADFQINRHGDAVEHQHDGEKHERGSQRPGQHRVLHAHRAQHRTHMRRQRPGQEQRQHRARTGDAHADRPDLTAKRTHDNKQANCQRPNGHGGGLLVLTLKRHEKNWPPCRCNGSLRRTPLLQATVAAERTVATA